MDFASEKITIAWAARVSFAQLGARLTSYIETRASITTFRCAARYTPIKALHKLPEELISMIANQVSDQSFYGNVTEWVQAEDCLADRCTPLSHLGMFCSRDDGKACDLLEFGYLDDESYEAHFERIFDWGKDVVNMDGRSKIAGYVRVSL